MSKKIVFVCTGNICRSAMAHGYMQKVLKDKGLENEYIIESAGTNAYTGDKATDFACNAMEKYNTDISKHRATYIEESDIKEADLILCGHTHKGQLFPANIITNLMYTVDYGYYQKDAQSPQVIVSSGVGYWGMPMRVVTQCEIVSIKIQ